MGTFFFTLAAVWASPVLLQTWYILYKSKYVCINYNETFMPFNRIFYVLVGNFITTDMPDIKTIPICEITLVRYISSTRSDMPRSRVSSFKITIYMFYNTPVAGCPWFCYWYLNNNSLWWKRSFVLGVGGRHTIPGNTYTCFHSVWSLCIKYQWTRVEKQFFF